MSVKRYQLESYGFEDGASHWLFVSDTGKYVLYSDRYALALEVLEEFRYKREWAKRPFDEWLKSKMEAADE